ncbi:MAG TPA: hypothetical protein VF257_17245 [Solirubrobacteraceae bacterium]
MSEVISIRTARSAGNGERGGKAGDGEAFRIVQRGGRTFHVYGSDEDRKVRERPRGTKPTGPESPTDGMPAA